MEIFKYVWIPIVAVIGSKLVIDLYDETRTLIRTKNWDYAPVLRFIIGVGVGAVAGLSMVKFLGWF